MFTSLLGGKTKGTKGCSETHSLFAGLGWRARGSHRTKGKAPKKTTRYLSSGGGSTGRRRVHARVRGREARGPCDSPLPLAHPLQAQVGGRGEIRKGQAGAETGGRSEPRPRFSPSARQAGVAAALPGSGRPF